MPQWLGDFLREWAPFAGLVVFVLGLIGGAFAGVGRLLYALFSNGVVVSKSRHQVEVDFYSTQVALCKEAADRRIAELTKDLADLRLDMERAVAQLTKDRDKWEARFWEAQKAGEFLIKRDTPPRGIHRPETGIGS